MASLFLAIVMVYIFLFQIKGNVLKGTIADVLSWTDIQISIMSGDDEQTLTPTDQEREQLQLATGTQTTVNVPATGVTVLWETSATTSNISGNMHILSWTNVFYGAIESIEKLGIKYQYALIDDKNIYYINLGTPTYDFAAIARKLWGNLYELKTETELVKNKLFGDKIVFINLPEYKEKRVLMLLYIDEEVRLIQMDQAIYHKSKSYLKSLFIQ